MKYNFYRAMHFSANATVILSVYLSVYLLRSCTVIMFSETNIMTN